MQKAREEGNFPSARTFVSAMQFLAFVSMLRSWGGTWVNAVHETMSLLLHHSLQSELSAGYLLHLSVELIKRTFMPLAILGAVLMGATLAAQLLVTRLGVSLQKLSPDPKRLNPLSRIRELPKQNLPAPGMEICTHRFFMMNTIRSRWRRRNGPRRRSFS